MAPKFFPSFGGVQPKAKARPTLAGKGVIGNGAKSGFGGKGLGKGGLRRHRYVSDRTYWRGCAILGWERRGEGRGGEGRSSTALVVST